MVCLLTLRPRAGGWYCLTHENYDTPLYPVTLRAVETRIQGTRIIPGAEINAWGPWEYVTRIAFRLLPVTAEPPTGPGRRGLGNHRWTVEADRPDTSVRFSFTPSSPSIRVSRPVTRELSEIQVAESIFEDFSNTFNSNVRRWVKHGKIILVLRECEIPSTPVHGQWVDCSSISEHSIISVHTITVTMNYYLH